MRTSLRLNNDVPVDRLLEIAAVAESAGFDQLWVSHDLFLRSAPVLMGVLAGATRRIQLSRDPGPGLDLDSTQLG